MDRVIQANILADGAGGLKLAETIHGRRWAEASGASSRMQSDLKHAGGRLNNAEHLLSCPNQRPINSKMALKGKTPPR